MGNGVGNHMSILQRLLLNVKTLIGFACPFQLGEDDFSCVLQPPP